ncbi:GNAT family N-acetyltransferase [Lentzea sp. NPDC055074]
MMTGMLVRVRAVCDADFARIPLWLNHSRAGVLVGGGQGGVSTEDGWRSAVEHGDTRYAVIETIAGEPIGALSWRQHGHRDGFELGGVVGDESLWDSGCGIEGAMLLADYLFQVEGAHRVSMTAALYNRRTIGFLVKGGCVIEALLRDYLFADGRYYDAVVCSLLREEFYAPFEGHQPTTSFLDAGWVRDGSRLLAGYTVDGQGERSDIRT